MARNFPRYTAIDLFSGCGGLTTGLKQAGFNVIAAVEREPLAAATYEANHPDIRIFREDIRFLSAAKLKRGLKLRKGELDLLAGCPPCQGFSSIRTLNGSVPIRDGGKNLVFEFVRFVRDLRPKVIMMENVPGLMDDTRMRRVLKCLSDLGYLWQCRVMDAADYAVPQRRKRMIVLGSLFGKVSFARRARIKRTVRDAIRRLPKPGKSDDSLHNLRSKHGSKVSMLIRRIKRDGGSRTDLPNRYQLPCHRTTTGFKDIYGRMAWDNVAPTITGGCVNPSKGRFLHPSQNRAISLREAAILQSFPSNYQFDVTEGKYPLAVLIGNAFPPEFVRRHALQVARHLWIHRKTQLQEKKWKKPERNSQKKI